MKNRFVLPWLVAAFSLFVFPGWASSLGKSAVNDAVYPLPGGAVKLDGGLETDLLKSLDGWNKGVVPYARLVDFFRNGRPQFALGEMWGKAVRSGCMFYRYTHDAELKRILQATVSDMLTTQRENGSFSCVPVDRQPDGPGGDLWERKYVMLAMEGYYEDVEQDARVLDALERHAVCIMSQIGPHPKTSVLELGWSPNHIESSTLLEPFMRLYKLTGKEAYLDFARYIVESGGAQGYNLFEQSASTVLPHEMGGPYPKAYEMLSLYEGLVEYYRVTGDEHLKTSFMNLFNRVKEHEMTIVGNGGGDQPYHPAVYGEAWDNTAYEQTNPKIERMMETCTGVTWLKFCSQVFRLTADASAMDYIEKYIYNGLLGAMKPEGDGFSYVNLLNGHKVTNHGWGMEIDGLPVTCCNLNGPMGLAYIPFIVVMKDSTGPVVNLYNACTVTDRTPSGHGLRMEIRGSLPVDSRIVLNIVPEQAERFCISLRMPSWSSETKVRVNGRRVKPTAPGRYLRLERLWKKGDRVELEFDMTARVVDAPKGSNRDGDNFRAVTYGPVVLARDEHIDSCYNQPVTLLARPDGTIRLKSVKPTLASTRLEFMVPTADGEIRMVDFSSVYCWDGKCICTWLPMK